jgi:hypothetical protein
MSDVTSRLSASLTYPSVGSLFNVLNPAEPMGASS